MPGGIRYNIHYDHKRKEVTIFIQAGAQPPMEIVMSAEAFYQDITFITKDKGLAKLMSVINERKDLPIDYDFGAGGGSFNMKEWDNKMEGENDKRD